jgi:hypothetical protein
VALVPQLTIRRTAAPFRAAYNALQAAQTARSAANKGGLIMKRVSFGCLCGTLLGCAVVLAVMAASANAASIAERAGPLQACLEGRFEKWVNSRSELVVNEDPKAGDIDDAAVARWALETVGACRAQAGGGDRDVEARFTKRVAQWRQHVYDRVQSIRELVRPD